MLAEVPRPVDRANALWDSSLATGLEGAAALSRTARAGHNLDLTRDGCSAAFGRAKRHALTRVGGRSRLAIDHFRFHHFARRGWP
jgi:hypothetical protein